MNYPASMSAVLRLRKSVVHMSPTEEMWFMETMLTAFLISVRKNRICYTAFHNVHVCLPKFGFLEQH